MAAANSHPDLAVDSVTTSVDPLAAPTQVTATPTLDGSTPVIETHAPIPEAIETPAAGVGLEGEETVWEGAYCLRNFLGRVLLRIAVTIVFIALAMGTWVYNKDDLLPMTIIVGLACLGLWISLAYRMTQARLGRSYRLTNRRLFVESGVMRRRHDQMELARLKDVFTRQTFLERWRGLGTVVVVPTERELPTFYLQGVENPHGVMDLVWHHARNERETRSA